MAEEALVKDALSEQQIAGGETVIRALDEAKFRVDAGFWLFLTDSNHWRLMLASPEVRLEGPKKAYRRVQAALSKVETPGVSLQNITVVDNGDSLVTLLRSAIRTGPGISGIRFSRNTINGVFIEDAYIYRLT